MTLPVVKRPLALRHMAEHFYFIAMDSERAASKFLVETEGALELIADMPTVGKEWKSSDERLDGLRFTTVSRRFRNYLLFYRVNPTAIELVAVLHASRDLHGALAMLLEE